MKSKIPVPAKYLLNPVHFIALGFGSGLMPKAPGTFGTLAAIPVYLLIKDLSLAYYLTAVVVVCLLGVYACFYTSTALNVHDHPAIVVDEIAGYLITMIAVPFAWQWVLAGFILFRFFDILKPWPISWIDKHVHGGSGIMLDDILAGVFAFTVLQILLRVI